MTPASPLESAPDAEKALQKLRGLIDNGMLVDRFRLRKEFDKIVRAKLPLEQILAAIDRSVVTRKQRYANLPEINFPDSLPISSHENELVESIRNNQVTVISGETGSGKSTQLPKLCLKAGYGIAGMICQTQPRRIAARSVAERISEELKSPVGQAVGYKVRFLEQISEQNYIRVLTDGMLLAEMERDRFLNQYEVIIIDEAHERSLNIDFLLGLLFGLLKRRPGLRLIVTSATLDTEKFVKHFNTAPAVTVSGRTFPVEMRYRQTENPLRSAEGLAPAILEAISELHTEAPGDVLVFLPGEREIRETAQWLGQRIKKGVEILPLYARLTPAEQHRIFNPGGKPRIILSTNVAETSLTVPGVRYVIDSGLARVSRYSPARKIQRLPLEKISRSAADQRAGRCGRVANGICIRLYDEEDLLNRPQFTDPEILRTSLADVILRMKSMKIGDIESFPFVDKPLRKQINDGLQQLLELGALNDVNNLSAVGRRIALMPVDPRIARMLIAAEEFGSLQEMIVIAAALSVPDPRQSPADKIQHSRQQHRALSEQESDFLVLLDIWRQFRHIQKTESKRQSYRWCEENYLSIFRMREWGALQASIRLVLKQLKMKINRDAATEDAIHRALLSGLLANVAQLALPVDQKSPAPKQGQGKPRKAPEYLGTFGKTLQIFPGSALKGKSPKWIMSAELVETQNLFARMVCKIDPQWLEISAKHLLQYHYSGPTWRRRQERVIGKRRATLYGLTIYSGKKCDYSKVDPVDCRAIFIRAALVDGELDRGPAFFRQNRSLAAEIEALEHKTRRRDILVDDVVIYDFYDKRIPPHVNSASELRKWLKSAPTNMLEGLLIPRELLMLEDQQTALQDYPDQLACRGIDVDLHYHFDPRSEKDGITATIKLPLLNQMNAAFFDRLVPGMLKEKLVAMIRTLPKELRRHFVPIPDTVEQLIDKVSENKKPVREALAAALTTMRNIDISASHFDLSQLPAYLSTGYSLLDDNGRELHYEKDLEELQRRFSHRAHESFVEGGDALIRRSGLKTWDFDSLPVSIPVSIDQYQTEAYPALVDNKDSVSIEVFDDPFEAESAHMEGVRRLLWLGSPSQRKLSKKPIAEWQRISLLYSTIGDLRDLQRAMFGKAQDQVFFEGNTLPRDKSAFDQMASDGSSRLSSVLVEIANTIAEVLLVYRSILSMLEENRGELSAITVTDVKDQLEWLVYDGFVEEIPVSWLRHIPRYLRGIVVRLEQAILDPATDQLRMKKVTPLWNLFMQTKFEYSDRMERWRWMLEEYRISVFAQGVGTSERVSAKRLDALWLQVIDENNQVLH